MYGDLTSTRHGSMCNVWTYSCAGRAVHQPGERGVRVHAGPGAGGRAGGHGTGTTGRRAHVPVPGVLVYGQRDIVPAEAVPGGGQSGRVLEPVSGHRTRHVGQDVAHQRRTGVLHRDLHRAQSVWYAQHGVADGVMNVAAPTDSDDRSDDSDGNAARCRRPNTFVSSSRPATDPPGRIVWDAICKRVRVRPVRWLSRFLTTVDRFN